MHFVRKIAQNSIFILVTRGIETIFNFLMGVFIARYLGVDDFGRYSLVTAIIMVLSPFIALGLPQILPREIAQKKEEAGDFLGTSLVLNGLAVTPVIIIALIAASFLNLHSDAYTALLIGLTFLVTREVRRGFISIFLGFEQMEYETVSVFLIRGLEFLLVLEVIHLDLGFIYLFAALAIVNFAGLIMTFFMLWKWFVLPRIKVNKDRLKYLLKEAYPIIFAEFSMMAFAYIDVFVLRVYAGNSEIGLYQSSQRILLGFMPIPLSIGVAIMPFFSKLAVSDPSFEKLRNAFAKACKFFLVLGLFIMIPMIVYARNIVYFLFGAAFLPASAVVQILFFALPFFFISSLARVSLVAISRQKYLMTGNIICVLVNLAADLLLVPRYGCIGAGIGTLSAAIALAGINVSVLLKHLQYSSLSKLIYLPLLISCFWGGILYKLADVNMLISLPGFLVAFWGSLFIFKVFTEDEINLLKQMVRKRMPQDGEIALNT
ncbi:MAG: flippase [Candidatus Schekmanbacteria bacterium]|nr:flippase [Candidatus Schekmanbacteria bacterium]